MTKIELKNAAVAAAENIPQAMNKKLAIRRWAEACRRMLAAV